MKSMNKITNAQELRATLLASIEAVLDGKMTVQQANSVANLSAELHKSIKQEWDMRVYAAQSLSIQDGGLVKMISEGP